MRSVSDLLFAAVSDYKYSGAIKIRDRIISYDELNQKALAVAVALIGVGASSETIGLVGQRKASAYIGILGILYSGNHYTPINPKYSRARLAAILRDARIRYLVGDAGDIMALESVLGAESFQGIIIVPEGEVPGNKNWIQPQPANAGTLTGPVELNADQLAYILYTSGSTGSPKGVQVGHANVAAFLRNMASLYPLAPGFRASQTFDLSFDPSVSDMFFTWQRGGLLCVLPEEEMFLPSEYINREKIDFWNSVPSLAAFMNKMGQLSAGSFPHLKHSMFCGEQFPVHIAEAWRVAAPHSTIENLYGPTEATIYISRFVYNAADSEKAFRNGIVPIGHPFPEHQVAIVDDHGSPVAGFETGEICFKGEQVTKGYLGDEVKTSAVFVDFAWDTEGGKWYKTGDLGFYNRDGDIECIGRRDSQIKLSGRRIEIGEIEAVLAKLIPTADAVVVPLRDEQYVVTGCVAFTTHPMDKSEENDIRKESETLLERIFFPKRIFTISQLPVSASGKIDRKKLELQARELLYPAQKERDEN